MFPVLSEKAAKNKSIQGQQSWQMGKKIISALWIWYEELNMNWRIWFGILDRRLKGQGRKDQFWNKMSRE